MVTAVTPQLLRGLPDPWPNTVGTPDLFNRRWGPRDDDLLLHMDDVGDDDLLLHMDDASLREIP